MNIRRFAILFVILVVLCLCLARKNPRVITTSNYTTVQVESTSHAPEGLMADISVSSAECCEIPADLAPYGEVTVNSPGLPIKPTCRDEWLPP